MKSIDDKLNTAYGVKSFDLKVDDIDESKRIVKGYLSAFDVKDSDEDVIRKGAFGHSIKQRGPEANGNRRIAHLRNHDWEQQIGKFLELHEDERGLVFVSQLGTSSKGEDALRDYEDGILREHSIGFNYVKNGIKKEENEEFGEFYEIKEVKLWEGSGVTFGANEFTPVLEVQKAMNDNDYMSGVQERIDLIVGVLKNGKGTDQRLAANERALIELKQIQQKYKSLMELKSIDKDALASEPSSEEVQKALKDAQEEKFRQMLINVLSK
jgi:HK97 family phage prohead protease